MCCMCFSLFAILLAQDGLCFGNQHDLRASLKSTDKSTSIRTSRGFLHSPFPLSPHLGHHFIHISQDLDEINKFMGFYGIISKSLTPRFFKESPSEKCGSMSNDGKYKKNGNHLEWLSPGFCSIERGAFWKKVSPWQVRGTLWPPEFCYFKLSSSFSRISQALRCLHVYFVTAIQSIWAENLLSGIHACVEDF